jgi:hypothetical protein
MVAPTREVAGAPSPSPLYRFRSCLLAGAALSVGALPVASLAAVAIVLLVFDLDAHRLHLRLSTR